MSDPTYCMWIKEQEKLAENARIMEEMLAKKKREEWRKKDLTLHKIWLEDQNKRRKLQEEKRLQEVKIALNNVGISSQFRFELG